MLRIGINGLGRVGRAVFRQLLDVEDVEIVAVNDLNADTSNLAYLLNYDTVYGRAPVSVGSAPGQLTYQGREVKAFSEDRIERVPWFSLRVDYVIDASGVAANVDGAREVIRTQNVDRVLVTHSPDNVDFTMVLGVNEHDFDAERHRVVSTSICDATAIAPIISVIEREWGVRKGFVTTLHPWLSYQNLVDGTSRSVARPGTTHADYALGRAAPHSLIPKHTSVVPAMEKVLTPIERGCLYGFSYRVPTSIVSSADVTLQTRRPISKNAFIEALVRFQSAQRWPIIRLSDEPLVSVDFLGSSHSVCFDLRWLHIIDDDMVKFVLWYDNEWGYAARVIDQLRFVHGQVSGSRA